MPMTRSELIYFAAGVAVGGAVGANWNKIQPLAAAMLGPAAAGLQDAYGDLLGTLAQQVEAFQDAAAEQRTPRGKKRAARGERAFEPSFN